VTSTTPNVHHWHRSLVISSPSRPSHSGQTAHRDNSLSASHLHESQSRTTVAVLVISLATNPSDSQAGLAAAPACTYARSILHAQGEHAHGRWVGLSYDGPVISGYATLARTQEQAHAVMTRVLDEATLPA
jgi:hypothetical protein